MNVRALPLALLVAASLALGACSQTTRYGHLLQSTKSKEELKAERRAARKAQIRADTDRYFAEVQRARAAGVPGELPDMYKSPEQRRHRSLAGDLAGLTASMVVADQQRCNADPEACRRENEEYRRRNPKPLEYVPPPTMLEEWAKEHAHTAW